MARDVLPTKKIDGRKYQLVFSTAKKGDVDQVVLSLRRQGFLVRRIKSVVKSPVSNKDVTFYDVYVHPMKGNVSKKVRVPAFVQKEAPRYNERGVMMDDGVIRSWDWVYLN
jgi:hypothetical protein